MKPQIRIQRCRTKGWKMPPNTVYVGRLTRWGNPFVVGVDGDAKECVNKYIELLLPYQHHGPNSGIGKFYISAAMLDDIRQTLRGKNLACWCPLTDGNGNPYPCHADVLLEWANEGEAP